MTTTGFTFSPNSTAASPAIVMSAAPRNARFPNVMVALATMATVMARRPWKAASTTGSSYVRAYKADRTTMKQNAGKPKPTKQTAAPARPRDRSPTYAAVCMAVAPGIVWQRATPS